MSTEHRWTDFFRRLNSILGTVILLGILAAVAIPLVSMFVTYDDATIQLPTDPNDAESETVKLRMGGLISIAGHDHHYVELHGRADTAYASYGVQRTRNLLFIHAESLETRWLFPTHQQLILETSHLAKEAPAEKQEVLALLYEIVESDSDGDGKLNREDQLSLAISRADGSGYKVLAKGLMTVISKQLSDDDKRLLVLSQRDNAVRLDSFLMEDFSALEGKVLATLGP